MIRSKFLRIEDGLSQRQLGSRTNLTQSEISLIEAGRLIPTSQQLARLAKFFGYEDAPARLLDHVCDDKLEPGADYRDSQREARDAARS